MCIKLGPCIRPKENCRETSCFYHEGRKPHGIDGADRSPEKRTAGIRVLDSMADYYFKFFVRGVSHEQDVGWWKN